MSNVPGLVSDNPQYPAWARMGLSKRSMVAAEIKSSLASVSADNDPSLRLFSVTFILIQPRFSIRKIHVIPAKAGIQMIKNSPRQWDNIMVLSASRRIFHCWIPAFAGMTV